ncbi:MAG: hypothetical protein JWM98_889 [Thermoleophilia bacterium]|nr:hypothetical protein [Thermoleophilia bacterium]
MNLAGAARAPDPQVAQATERYRPNHVGVDEAQFGRVVDIARESLEGLAPVIVVNRRMDDATQTLARAGEETLGTIHTSPPPGVLGTARRAARTVTEKLHLTHGTGENVGRTVFATTRFVGTQDAAAGARGVLEALERQGSVGVEAYGPVSLIVPVSQVEGRATFAARDTAKGVTRVTGTPHLPEVIAERLARGADHAPTIDSLVSQPRAAAVDALRGWLLGPSLARRDSYVEAQVRGLAIEDIAAVHVSGKLRPEDAFKNIDAGAAPTQADVDRLTSVAAAHDIAVGSSL